MKKPKFLINHIYHLYNRGVDKRDIFLDDEDHFRFIHNLFEFNDTAPAENTYYKLLKSQSYEVELRKIEKELREPRKLVVEIFAFCMMTNHFHLLVRQKTDGGVVAFMQKLGTGYTNYFNKKYKRTGALFQGRFRAILVEQEPHFIHLPFYIHANPLSIIKPNWKEEGIGESEEAMEFLTSYRWSSHSDYAGKKNFPSITQREFLSEFMEGPEQYEKEMARWLKEFNSSEIEGFKKCLRS